MCLQVIHSHALLGEMALIDPLLIFISYFRFLRVLNLVPCRGFKGLKLWCIYREAKTAMLDHEFTF